MAPDDCLRVDLPGGFLKDSVSQLLDRIFPLDEQSQRGITDRFDLRANPDLTDIYTVFLAVCEEWRDWRCALLISSGGRDVQMDAPISGLLNTTSVPPILSLRLEQQYRALDYAVHHGFWESRNALLDWMRSLSVLYFLDKHEAALPVSPSPLSSPALVKALEYLQSQGIIAPQEKEEQDGESQTGDATAGYVVTSVGRRFIAGLLSETESYIDSHDHCQDALVDVDRDYVEFGTGLGLDLRVQAFMAEGLDPVRTVFLLRMYDGTFDARLRDWTKVLETEEFFEAVLEPVVNRDEASPEAMQLVVEHGYAWLEDQQEQALREASDRDLLRRAGAGEP